MFTLHHKCGRVRVELTHDGKRDVYRLIFPDDSRKFLYLSHNSYGHPCWEYLAGESANQAREMGCLLNEKATLN